ncbi:MAG: nucleotidyltransferase family protein [Archangiaceae bacterium]|nr:nucleotidyltransferase family protein [Archangiaceae bacterium]
MTAPVIDLVAELELLVDALNQASVPYALCGGLALAIHGHPRATKDIDLLVPAEAVENALRAAARAGFTLRAGPIPLGVKTPTPQTLFRATKVSAGSHITTDVLEVSASYGAAWALREVIDWRGRRLSLLSRSGLIAMKRLSSRTKDQSDVVTLEQREDEEA